MVAAFIMPVSSIYTQRNIVSQTVLTMNTYYFMKYATSKITKWWDPLPDNTPGLTVLYMAHEVSHKFLQFAILWDIYETPFTEQNITGNMWIILSKIYYFSQFCYRFLIELPKFSSWHITDHQTMKSVHVDKYILQNNLTNGRLTLTCS